MEAVAAIATWTFVAECPIPNDVADLLVPGEQPVAGIKPFGTVRFSPPSG